MDLCFYEQQLHNMLNDFYVLTGISTSIYNLEQEVTYCTADFPQYCQTVRQFQQCFKLNEDACREAARCGHAVSYCCPAGLCETVLPIFFGPVLAGYFVFGQCVDREEIYADRNVMEEFCRKHQLDVQKMAEKRAQLPILDTQKRNAMIRFADIMIHTMLEHNMILPREDDRRAAVIRYLDENYQKPLTVQELCRVFFISRSDLYKLFSNAGLTPHEYLGKLRMEKAKQLLETTSLSLTEIAEQVGIGNYNYFIRAFRRAYQTSPGKYRRGHSLGEEFSDISLHKDK